MAFKILVTEGASPLGAALFTGFEGEQRELVCPSMTLDDWGREDKVTALLKSSKPALLINTLQYVDPESSIQDPSIYRVLSKVCCDLEVPVVHISSHEVFSVQQQKKRAMCESDVPEPDTESGLVFLRAEQAFLENQHCIALRIPWVLDFPGGVLEKVLCGLAHSSSIQASESWRGSLVAVDDIVRTILGLSRQILCDAQNWGVAHIRSSDVCGEMELIDYVQRVLTKSGCEVAEVNLLPNGQRFIETNGWLTGTVCTNGFGVQFRSWRQGLKAKIITWVNSQVDSGDLKLLDTK